MRINQKKDTFTVSFYLYSHRKYLFYTQNLANEKGDYHMEHPLARELRNIRICLIILIIVIAF